MDNEDIERQNIFNEGERFTIVPDDEKEVKYNNDTSQMKKNMQIIKCELSSKAYNNTLEVPIGSQSKIFFCSCKNIIICESCKLKCHRNENHKHLHGDEDIVGNNIKYEICELLEYTKNIKGNFYCQCNHDHKNQALIEVSCKYYKFNQNDMYCPFCSLMCHEEGEHKKVKSENTNEDLIEKQFINKFKHFEVPSAIQKDSRDDMEELYFCKCNYFYHNSIFYRIVFYDKIIKNFSLNPDLNLFHMFYEKRNELLRLLFNPLKNLVEDNDISDISLKNIEEFEKFGKNEQNIHLLNLLDLLNNGLTTILPLDTDYFFSWEEFDDGLDALFKTFKIIQVIIKVKPVEYFLILQGRLLEFYRKYYVIPKIRSIFPLIGFGQNVNPIHRIIFSENPKQFYRQIEMKKKDLKRIMDLAFNLIFECFHIPDCCEKLIREYLELINIMIHFRFTEEELMKMMKNTLKIVEKLPMKIRKKVEDKIEKISYSILLVVNDNYFEEYIFKGKKKENEISSKLAFNEESALSRSMINLIFASKKTQDEDKQTIPYEMKKKIDQQKLEIFDILVNKNDFYAQSLLSVYQSKKFFGSFLKSQSTSMDQNDIESQYPLIFNFFNGLQIKQNDFFRKKINNDAFFEESKAMFKNAKEAFGSNRVFHLSKSQDLINVELQLKIFKFGYIQKLVFFVGIFLDVSYFIKYKSPKEINEIFSDYFDIIRNYICKDNPFLISLFFNSTLFDFFFPPLPVESNEVDEFSENDAIEAEISQKKIDIYFLFLKKFSDFLIMLRKLEYKLDFSFIIDRLFDIVKYKGSILRMKIDAINDLLKIFILCLQSNDKKTKDILQQKISNFIQYIFTFHKKIESKLKEFIDHMIKDKTEEIENSKEEKKKDEKEEKEFKSKLSRKEILDNDKYQKLLKRTFKLILKLNSTYFNFLYSNLAVFKINSLSNGILSVLPNLTKYFLNCYARYYLTNFYEIKAEYTFADAKNIDDIDYKDHLIITSTARIFDYCHFLSNYEIIFNNIDGIEEFKEVMLNEKNSNYPPFILKCVSRYLRLYFSFYSRIFAVPIIHTIFKILRMNQLFAENIDKFKEEEKEEEIFRQTVQSVVLCIHIFIHSFKSFKKRVLKIASHFGKKLSQKEFTWLTFYIDDLNEFKKIMVNNDKFEQELENDIRTQVINIKNIISKFSKYQKVFFKFGAENKETENEDVNKDNEKDEDSEAFKKELGTFIEFYDNSKDDFESNVLAKIFKNKHENQYIMKNIGYSLLQLVSKNVKNDKYFEDDPDQMTGLVEQELAENLVESNEELKKRMDDIIKQNIEETKLNNPNESFISRDTSVIPSNILSKDSGQDINEQLKQDNQDTQETKIQDSSKKSQEHNHFKEIYNEQNIILFECINRLFKIEPEFWQLVLVNFKKTGNLVKRICHKELIFLLQSIINDYYTLETHDLSEKSSNFVYFTYLIEFIRLFNENFNKVFKSLFFQLKFNFLDYNGDEDDDSDLTDPIEIVKTEDDQKHPMKWKKTFYFMSLIFKIFSAVIKHSNSLKKEIVDLFLPIPDNYFDDIFKAITGFIVETVQGNYKQNFELLGPYFNNFFYIICNYINDIKVENNAYHDEMINMMTIIFEYFQEAEVPNRFKNNLWKKINNFKLTNILVYKTKVLMLLSKKIKKGSKDTLETLYLKLQPKDNVDKENDAKKKDSQSRKSTENFHQKKSVLNRITAMRFLQMNDKKSSEPENLNPSDLVNMVLEEGDHKSLQNLYERIVFENTESFRKEKFGGTKLEKVKKVVQKPLVINLSNLKRIGKHNLEEENEEVEKQEEVIEAKEEDINVYRILILCTKIFQYFKILEQINENSAKVMEGFENANKEIEDRNKFSFFDYFMKMFKPDFQKKIDEQIVSKNEMFLFYNSILRSIEVVHKLKLFSDEVDPSKYEHIFENFDLNVHDLIDGDSSEETIIRKIVYLVDPLCLELKYKEIKDMFKSDNLEESTQLLSFMIEHLPDFKNIMFFRNEIKKEKLEVGLNGKSRHFCRLEKINFTYLHIISLIFAVLTNVKLAMNAKLNSNYEVIDVFDPWLLVITFFHLIFLGSCCAIYFYINYYKLTKMRDFAMRSHDQELGKYWSGNTLNEKIKELPWNNEIFYLIWSFIFALIAMLFHSCLFLYSLLLFPVFQFIETINDILFAIKSRFDQFTSAASLILVIVFVYSMIAFFIYKDKFFNPETGENVCDEYSKCFLSILSSGLRGDGIGATESDEEASWGYVAFLWTFYLAVVLILLNAVNGIIVDVFQYLREKSDGENSFRDKCYICSNHKNQFEACDIKFDFHIKKEHFILDYIYYIITRTNSSNDDSELNFSEFQVKNSIKQKKIDYFPLERSMSLDKVKDLNE